MKENLASVAMPGISLNHYDYTAFFHYKPGCHTVIVDWIRSVSLQAVMSLEHEDHENVTDRHVQAWIRLAQPWDQALNNALTKKGCVGKYLVEHKVANVGAKGGKRWSKQRSTISRTEAIQYVLKDGGPEFVHNVEIDEEMRKPPDKVMELRGKRESSVDKPRSKPFHEKLMEVWEESGRPREHRQIYQMLLENMVLNKWNYCDGRSVYRMATYIMLRVNQTKALDRMMSEYDRKEYCC